MQCKYCGQMLDQNAKFCLNCGKACESVVPVSGQPVGNVGNPTVMQPSMPTINNSGNDNKKMMFIIVGVLVAVVVAVVVFFLINNSSSKDEKSNSNTNSTGNDSSFNSNSNVSSSNTNNGSKVTHCSLNTQEEDVILSGTYKVTSKDGVVMLVETEEEIETDDDYKRNLYKVTIETNYLPYADLEHYNYEVSTSGNRVISSVSIDYEKLDTDEMIRINPAMASYIKGGKLYLEDLLELYALSGITCEK